MNYIPVSASSAGAKALTAGNSTNAAWTTLILTPNAPSGDGVFSAGHGGSYAPQFIKIFPYCDGPAGQTFSFRVFAWDVLMSNPQAQQPQTWVPSLIGEFLCTACNQPGFFPIQPLIPCQSILVAETMCDTITLTQGTLGAGLINSTGPGTDLVAFVKLDLLGCRYFQFDFNQSDNANVGMNCFWSKC